MTKILNNLELDIMSKNSFNNGHKELMYIYNDPITEEDASALDTVFLDIESDQNKQTKRVCKICEEENSIPIYKDTCSVCHLKTHQHDLCKTEELELYNAVNNLQPTITDREHLRSVMKLKRKLAEELMSIDRFNPLIESKCPQCRNPITDRDLSFGENPHSLYCRKGHYFCSNCGALPHTSANKYHKTCEEYKIACNKFKIPFVATWSSGIRNNETEHKKTIELRESEQKSLDYLRLQDYRICPYTDYDTAKKYERLSGAYNLTLSHNKKNWHLVACKSIPVMKENCNDMYCAKHNPERTRGTVVSQNHNGCGRRINWTYWKKINENFDKRNYSIYTMPQSDIADVTSSYDIIQKPKRCFICKKTTTCLHVKCTQYDCKFNNKNVCGNCVVKSTTVSNVKQEFKSITIQSIVINGVNVKNLKFLKNRKGVFICSLTLHDGKKTCLYIENSTGNVKYKDTKMFGHIYNLTQLLSGLIGGSLYFAPGEYNPYNYSYHYHSNRVFIDCVPVTNQYVVFNSYKCIREGHVLEFDGLESLQNKLSNIDQFKPYNDAAKKINLFLKRRYIINKWVNLITNKRSHIKETKQHIQAINSMLLRRKWKRVIKMVIERRGTFETNNYNISIDKPIACCIIC
jgi:hypothetical protein